MDDVLGEGYLDALLVEAPLDQQAGVVGYLPLVEDVVDPPCDLELERTVAELLEPDEGLPVGIVEDEVSRNYSSLLAKNVERAFATAR